MPEWIGWLENLSTIKWCFEAYCINEYNGLEFCDEEFGCQTGEEVLELLSFDKYGVWVPTFALLGLFGGFHFVAYSCLRFNRVRYIACEAPSESHYNYLGVDVGDVANGRTSTELKTKSAHNKTPLL